MPVWGTSGGPLTERSGELVCEICERFFGVSSEVKTCKNCGSTCGAYKKVDAVALSFLSDYHGKKWRWEKLSRVQANYMFQLAELVVRLYELFKSREVTAKGFGARGIPREFGVLFKKQKVILAF
jgi:hypothetical protein